MIFRFCLILTVLTLGLGFIAIDYGMFDAKWLTFIIPGALIIGIIGASHDHPYPTDKEHK